MVVRLTLAALATPSMVSPGNPTRASSAMVALRTFSTTRWLRGPRCTPVVRRVDLSMGPHASTGMTTWHHTVAIDRNLGELHVGQSASEGTGAVDRGADGLG